MQPHMQGKASEHQKDYSDDAKCPISRVRVQVGILTQHAQDT